MRGKKIDKMASVLTQRSTDGILCVMEITSGHREQLRFRVGATGMRDGYVRSCIEI